MLGPDRKERQFWRMVFLIFNAHLLYYSLTQYVQCVACCLLPRLLGLWRPGGLANPLQLLNQTDLVDGLQLTWNCDDYLLASA